MQPATFANSSTLDHGELRLKNSIVCSVRREPRGTRNNSGPRPSISFTSARMAASSYYRRHREGRGRGFNSSRTLRLSNPDPHWGIFFPSARFFGGIGRKLIWEVLLHNGLAHSAFRWIGSWVYLILITPWCRRDRAARTGSAEMQNLPRRFYFAYEDRRPPLWLLFGRMPRRGGKSSERAISN
jgi:hypothetical protein